MEDPRRLKVYLKALQLEQDVHGAVRRFPLSYRRKTGVQLDDAAESIGSNISEGCGRKSRYHGNGELIRYLHLSMGSANEVEHRLRSAFWKNFIDKPSYERLNNQTVEVKRMLATLIRKLDEGDRGPTER